MACPWVSLISLKRSRSKNRSATRCPWRWALASACLSRSRNNARLGRPCNVVVREDTPGLSTVAFIDPQTMVALSGNPQVREVADDAAARLARVRERLAAG